MLPNIPITSIRIFEAAARTESFRAAADELGLTSSAVSHAITKLETALGNALFERSTRAVRLTPAGQNLLRHAGAAFDELRQGFEEVSARGPQLVRVHSAPSFAAQWLAPRLSRFLGSQPKLDVRLAASTDYARFSNDDYDIDIVYGEVRAEGVEIIPLKEETVTPLCAPAVAALIQKPADLFKQTLIRSDVKKVQWHQWLAANGLESTGINRMRFDRSFLALAAAVEGLGVALESTMLAEREIATGRLVAPLDGRSTDVRYTGHHLVYPRARRLRAPVRAFADWIKSELDY